MTSRSAILIISAGLWLACGGLAMAGTPGPDVLTGGPGPDILDGGAGGDILNGAGGSDTLLGGPHDDVLIGGAGADTLNGGLNDDLLLGGPGDDILRGSDGDDFIVGGDGNDRLVGGPGQDYMKGGPGADIFVFVAAGDSTPGQPDLIGDFRRLQGDRIDLSAILPKAKGLLKVVPAFTGAPKQVVIDTYPNFSVIRVDLNGDKVADAEIHVQTKGVKAIDLNL